MAIDVEPSKPPLDQATADKIEFLKRMVISHADLQTSLSAVTFLNEIEEDEKYNLVELRRFKCYETAFVVAYGRAFTKSAGSKYTQLSLKRIGVSLTEKERLLHEVIVAARQKKYAHSDLEKAHARIDLHVIKDDKFKFPVHHVQWDEGLDFIGGLMINDIMDLIRKIMAALFNSTRTLAVELTDHLPIYITPV